MATGEVTPAGLGCRDSLRLEMGMALYGNDIDDTVTPLEANLGWIVKLHEGRLRRTRRARQAEGAGDSAEARRIHDGASARSRATAIRSSCNGEPSGVVCSGTMSPSLNIPIGTCYLPTAHAKPGSELGIDIRGKLVQGGGREDAVLQERESHL